MEDDSLPLEGGVSGCRPPLRSYPLLLAIFLCVSSDAFIDSVISRISAGAVRGRALSSFGVVLQGIIIVILYAAATELIGRGIL